jgi:hypothetical protein
MISHKYMNWTGNSVIVGAVLQQHALCLHYVSSWYSVGWYTRFLLKSFFTKGLTSYHHALLQFNLLEKAWTSVADHHAGYDQAVHLKLKLADLLNRRADGVRPLVELHASNTATCKAGQFLVRTTAKRLVKVDHFAAIPWEGDAGGQYVLKVDQIYRWVQHEDSPSIGEEQPATCRGTHRFAVGTLIALHACGCSEFGYEMQFCDGADGERRRYPSLLKRGARTASGRVVQQEYKYAVWLRQVEGTYVSDRTVQSFMPTAKGGLSG